MCAIVSHRGGTVIEFIGDAMLVVWNIPLPVANHAERCVLFAMEAQQELRDLRQIWLDRGLPRVEVRMGVHTGLVYAGILGSAARFKCVLTNLRCFRDTEVYELSRVLIVSFNCVGRCVAHTLGKISFALLTAYLRFHKVWAAGRIIKCGLVFGRSE